MTYEVGERDAVLATVRRLVGPAGVLAGFLANDAPLAIARAPGRLDVMGGIADYSGSLVLELPIREAAFVVAQIHPEPVVHAVSVAPDPPHAARRFATSAAPLGAADYERARTIFRHEVASGGEGAAFAPYVAGTVVALSREEELDTTHPICEHERVVRFAGLLRAAMTPAACVELGALMYESHASYSACGLGSAATDAIVGMVRDLGSAAGLLGAKITGGGSGGTVAVLARRDAERSVRDVVDRYARESGTAARLFEGSSMGATELGALRLEAGWSSTP